MKPEFEEKSYEAAFNAEIEFGQPGATFAPGQVAEASLGVDVLALLSKRHPFWRTVGLYHRRGRRVTKAAVPDEVFNLFLQYKRSDHIVGPNGRHHRTFGSDYYRFVTTRPTDQLETLQALERATASLGHVRYVAPEFSTLAELRDAQRNQRVIQQSVVVAPSMFGKTHKAYNFKSGRAVLNPVPEWVDVDLATTLFEHRREVVPFRYAIGLMSAALEEGLGDVHLRNLLDREVQEGAGSTELPDGSRDFLMLAGLTWATGTQWLPAI